tara:strand:- start:30829 stop:31050 length:222 start_codon:yes stop_codon:yes gene_type:complete
MLVTVEEKQEIKIQPLIRMPQLLRVIPLSRNTIYKKMRDGSFPQSVKLSSNSVAWRESDIVDWLDSLVKGGDK